MGAPEHVPATLAPVRAYRSAPRRPGSWMADRPGELGGRQPEGERLGSPGPDQGYALTLAQRLRDELVLGPGEHAADALAVAVAVGLKRAAHFGRAPISDDLRAGLAVWHLDVDCPAELVEHRRELLEECHHPHHYAKLRAVVDAVPTEALARPLAAIRSAASADWRSCLTF